jgi:hypothetical protein
MVVRVALAISLVALMVACGRDGGLPATQSLSPVAPSSASATADHVSTQRREDLLVDMQDACDPETFNASSISCVRSGGVTFDEFIAKLTRFGDIGPWRFAPAVAQVQVGANLRRHQHRWRNSHLHARRGIPPSHPTRARDSSYGDAVHVTQPAIRRHKD